MYNPYHTENKTTSLWKFCFLLDLKVPSKKEVYYWPILGNINIRRPTIIDHAFKQATYFIANMIVKQLLYVRFPKVLY